MLTAPINQPQMTENEFELHLVSLGLILNIPPPMTDFSNYRNRQLIHITGKPLSETIIEDRGE